MSETKRFKLKPDETAITYAHVGYDPRSLVIKKKDFSKMAEAMCEAFKLAGIEARVELGAPEEPEEMSKLKKKPKNVLSKPIPKGK